MSKQNTRATIDANIKQNGQQLITGQILNSVLNTMVTDYAEQAETTEALATLNRKVGKLSSYGELPSYSGVLGSSGIEDSANSFYKVLSVNPNDVVSLKAGTTNILYYVAKTFDVNDCAVIDSATGFSGRQAIYANASGIITIPNDGHYLIIADVRFGTNYRPLQILINGSNILNDVRDEVSDIKNKESLFTSDYPLFNGGLNLKGEVWANADRRTTGVIANGKKLHISVNAPYNVSYLYGDIPTSLTDGGYIISGYAGGEVDIEVNAKFVGFTIVKQSSASFDGLRLMIYPTDANEGKIISLIDEKQDSINKVLYETYSEVKQTLRSTPNVTYNNILKMPISAGDVFLVKLDASTDIFKTRGLAVIPSYSGDAIGRAYADRWTEIVMPRDTETIGITLFSSLVVADNVTFRVKKKNVALEQKKIGVLTNTTTVSDPKEMIAVSDAFDISEFGKLCAGMAAASNAVGEYGTPSWNGYLLLANLADLEGTRQQILCYDHSNIAGLGYVEQVQHGMAKWTGDDEVTTIFQPVYRPNIGGTVRNDLQYSSFVVRKYTPSTNTWGTPMVADINVKGTTYRLETKWDISGTRAFTAEQVSEITAIWNTTGIQHPSRSADDMYCYSFGNNFFKYEGVWYAVFSLGAMSHTLCKSSDLIHWTFVCDIPFGQISLEEACVCIYKNKVYAMSRGENQLDGKDSQIMYCSFSSLSQSTQDWSTPVTLTGCHRERPTIAALNDRLYIMQGRGTSPTTEGKTIARGGKSLIVMDLNLNIIKRNDLDFTYPLLHPQFMSYGGNLFMCTSADKRCLAWTKGGDTRSEIGFAHLDEKILAL